MIQIHSNKKFTLIYSLHRLNTQLCILKYTIGMNKILIISFFFLKTLNMLSVNMPFLFPTVMVNRGRVENALQ